MTDWQPIETAPKDWRQRILVTGGYTFDNCDVYIARWSGYPIGKWNEETGRVETVLEYAWRWEGGGPANVTHPTHWRPLPAAPERVKT